MPTLVRHEIPLARRLVKEHRVREAVAVKIACEPFAFENININIQSAVAPEIKSLAVVLGYPEFLRLQQVKRDVASAVAVVVAGHVPLKPLYPIRTLVSLKFFAVISFQVPAVALP